MQEKEGYRYGWFTVPVVSLISGAREGGIPVWLVHCARCVFDFRCKRRRDTGMAGSLCQLCVWRHGAAHTVPPGSALHGAVLHPHLPPPTLPGRQGAPHQRGGHSCSHCSLSCCLVSSHVCAFSCLGRLVSSHVCAFSCLGRLVSSHVCAFSCLGRLVSSHCLCIFLFREIGEQSCLCIFLFREIGEQSLSVHFLV